MVPVIGRDGPGYEYYEGLVEVVEDAESDERVSDPDETEDDEDIEIHDDTSKSVVVIIPGPEPEPRHHDGKQEVKSPAAKRVMKKVEAVVVDFRMPYNLPLIAYHADEVPWCTSMAHDQPYYAGRAWSHNF